MIESSTWPFSSLVTLGKPSKFFVHAATSLLPVMCEKQWQTETECILVQRALIESKDGVRINHVLL